MPDIQMRFMRDMLVLSEPLESMLAQRGFDVPHDMPYLLTMEPETVEDAMRTVAMTGAQCLVTPTAGITSAQLAHVRMSGDAQSIAQAAVAAVVERKPQHILAEIGPCGLPLDASSKASLNENRSQYAQAARAFEGLALDAFFLNGFTSIADLKCALMGIAQVAGIPVFASVRVADGCVDGVSLRPPIADAFAAMADLGASVLGFETAESPAAAVSYARQAAAFDLPVLAQLFVKQKAPKQGGPTDENPYYCADAMERAAVELYGAGVQFLRATGKATPAYTGALVATVSGLDVRGYNDAER